MKHLDLLTEFRTLMARFVSEVEASGAMGMYDTHRVAENLMAGLFRELYDWRSLRNLNVTQDKNFPGIDLADDLAGISIQVTATPSLDKIKHTIETFIRHQLHLRYQRLVVYVLTHRQARYSQQALDQAASGLVPISEASDILDFKDICARAAEVSPTKLAAALGVLRDFMHGTTRGLSDADFDPPTRPAERVDLNLVEVYFPKTLYIADLHADVRPARQKRISNERKLVRESLARVGLRAPSDYEVLGGQLVTFYPLDNTQGPFAQVVDLGTVTPLRPREFYSGDEARERVFKSLLRFVLQQKLYKHAVQWMHEEALFAFVPRNESDTVREETWQGQRTSTRRVYERKSNRKDPSKTFICKHFAFAADFVRVDEGWYVALTPDWYFSHGSDYRRSKFADQSLAWLKRQEVNRTVYDHFRFLTAWLGALDSDDLFGPSGQTAPTLTFGEVVSFANHPALPDESWLPLRDAHDDRDVSAVAKLFEPT